MFWHVVHWHRLGSTNLVFACHWFVVVTCFSFSVSNKKVFALCNMSTMWFLWPLFLGLPHCCFLNIQNVNCVITVVMCLLYIGNIFRRTFRILLWWEIMHWMGNNAICRCIPNSVRIQTKLHNLSIVEWEKSKSSLAVRSSMCTVFA